MKRLVWGLAVSAISALPLLVLHAKSETTLIELKREGQPTVKVTDAAVRRFNIWEGPGVGGFKFTDGNAFIVAWTPGAMVRPSGLTRYQVVFSVGAERIAAYAVSYEYDPSTKRGYVYIPKQGEQHYAVNATSIYRGPEAEGHWFLATEAWNDFARPLIRG